MKASSRITIPFLIITLALITGIVLGYHFSIHKPWITLAALGTSILVLAFLKKTANSNDQISIYFGSWMIIVFILIGINLIPFHNPLIRKNHYTNLEAIGTADTQHEILFHISERLKPSRYYEKYIVTLQQIGTISVQGKLLLEISKDGLSSSLSVNDSYISYAPIRAIPKPLNPYQFDYAAYMKRQYVYHKIQLPFASLIKTNIQKPNLKGMANRIRNFLITRLQEHSFSEEELSIIKALLLGQRQDIDPETYQNYTKAGAIHILAVSGLHIGVFLLLFNLLLSPLLYFRQGKVLRTVIVIVLLWSYALITGLSPSVLRAVTMFSFIAVGMTLQSRRSSINNSLMISAFLLLCFQPLLLFDVGFQLSYLAIIAIVWIQPLLASLYRPRFYLDRLYWNTFTVTVAAQLGLLPLSIYYFHQFPLLFFVSNLIIVPFLGIILGFGVLVLAGSAITKLPDSIVQFYGSLIRIMNTVIDWVATQKSFLLTDISWSWSAMMSSYFLIAAVILLLKKFKPQRVYYATFAMALFLAVLISEHYQTSRHEALLIFHQTKNTIFGHQTGGKLTVHSAKKINDATQNYVLTPYKNAKHITLQEEKTLKNVYRYKEKSILIIDSSEVYNLKNLKPDVVLLSHSPRIHLDRLLDSLEPKLIIADGSNYKSMIARWQSTCELRNISFYRTDIEGAFVME